MNEREGVVKLVLQYGSETWVIKKIHVQILHVTEMRMLRSATGVIVTSDRVTIRSELIRGSFEIGNITDKLIETRLGWFGNIIRRPVVK